MDLATLDTRQGAEDGFELTLVHPQTGEPLDIKIKLRGADSDSYQHELREQQRRNRNRFNRAGRMLRTPEEDQADELDLIVSATIGWTGLNIAGADVAFSTHDARKVYERFPWIREQADRAINDRGNFLPNAAKA